MAYEKQNFYRGQILEVAHMEKIENAIIETEQAVANCYNKNNKQELANDILALLPTWTGGSY